MKKKGLIIATIVMVLVLAVSLTTATYAWFTAASKASVTSIGFSVTSDSDVVIGVTKTNAYVTSATNDSFVSGDGLNFQPYETDKWAGSGGLGYSIDTGLQLTGLTQAVWSGTVAGDPAVYSVDAKNSFNAGASVFVKASGSADSITTGTTDLAIANGYVLEGESSETRGDYLDVCFGVKANKETVTGIALVIGVKATGTATTLGMNAAINYTYKLDNGSWSALTDIYGNDHYNTTKSSMTAPSVSFNGATNITIKDNNDSDITWAKGDAVAVISIATSMTSANYNDIHQLHLRLFIGGYDSDCNNAAAQASATINLNFIATKSV